MPLTTTPSEVKSKLLSGDEIALLDVREEGVFAMGHLLFARSVPLSRRSLSLSDEARRIKAIHPIHQIKPDTSGHGRETHVGPRVTKRRDHWT